MSIVLKSEELRRYFRNNGVLTEQMANSIFNKINIELVTTAGGKVSQDLLEDLALIRDNYPKLLRHTTIINNTGFETNLQPIIDVLATYPTLSHDSLKSLTIKSKYDSDYNLDYTKLQRIEKVTLSGGNRVSKVSFDPKKLPTRVKKGVELELENFDLSGLDLNGSKVNALSIKGRGTKNFTRVKGLEQVRTFTVANKDLDREFYDMVDFINGPKSNVSTLIIDSVNLSTERPFEMLKSDKIVQLDIKNCKLNNLEGFKAWHDRLTGLDVRGNDLTEKEIPTLMEFIEKHPIAYADFDNNTGIKNFFNSVTTENFSEHTRRNIYNSLFTTDGPRDVKNKDVLQKLSNDSSIPIAITDAEIIRGQAKVTANPIEIPDGVDLSRIDFNKEYLKGGTLLLSQAQIAELKKFGNLPKDMTLAVRITSAKDLDGDTIRKLYHEDGVKKVIMMNEDGIRNTRIAYSANDYFHIRNILDEIVAGIDPKEFDFEKFTTVYSRVADIIKYDHSVIDRTSTEGLRLAGSKRNDCRNLKNGLFDGTCVCAGYAEILRNALSLVDIKCKYLVGKTFDDPDLHSLHAWNAVELADENNVKRWYLTDPTWDAGKVLGGKPSYMLMDKDTFTRKGHQKYLSYDVPEISDKAYSRNRLTIGIEKARERMLDPRASYIEKRNKKKKEKASPIIKREEPKKKEPEKKEPEKKEPEKKPVEKKERVQSDEEKADREKREWVRAEMDNIYRILESTLGLDSSSRKKYYGKLAELEIKMKELDKKIGAYGEVEQPKSSSKEEQTNNKQPKKVEIKTERKTVTVNAPVYGANIDPKAQTHTVSDNDKKYPMSDIKMKSNEMVELETKLTKEQIKENQELEDYIDENKDNKANLPAVRDRNDLIAAKKDMMQRNAENKFVKFTNKLFKRNDEVPPKFISGIIKFSLNTRFWAQDIIREIRQKDDKIDDELSAILMADFDFKNKRKDELLSPEYMLKPRPYPRKKTYAERETERYLNKHGAGRSNSGRVDDGR